MVFNGVVVGLLKFVVFGCYCVECVGVGVVRGIDVDNCYVYIFMSVSSEKFKSVTIFAFGILEFLLCLFGYVGEYLYM